MTRNPFKPTAGANPPLLVGRDELIAEFSESIDDGPGAPMRLSIFTGPRGVGKTVILNAIADCAQDDYQWLVFHETATPGFLVRLMRAIEKSLDQKARRSITGVTLPLLLGSGGGGVQVSAATQERPTDDFREVIAPLLDRCEANGTGVLVTIDEVHTDNSIELRQLATAVQHIIREERQFALAFAGLPTAVDDLLTANQITFLRRADRRDLKDVPLADVGQALNTTINESGHTITAEALELATQATGGYPFMIQLVGYQIWRNANGNTITTTAVAAGIEAARTRLGSLVHAPALRELSDVDRTYLLAMAQDDGPSKTAEIARRMDKSPQYASVYRARLIAAGMIEPATHGTVRFAIPYLRDYLIQHAAHQAMTTKDTQSHEI